MAHSNPFLQEMEHVLLRQQEPILILKLTMYAADAMRVLSAFGRQADISPTLSEALKGICPDWRNPGAIEDPVDLIAQALFYSLDSLQKAILSMERVTQAMRAIARLMYEVRQDRFVAFRVHCMRW